MSKSPRAQADSSNTEAGATSEPQARPGFRVKIPDHILSASSATGGNSSCGNTSNIEDAALSKPPPPANSSAPVAASAASAPSTSTTTSAPTGVTNASRPPQPAVPRARQSRAEQLLRDLDADIERDRQNRSRRSYSADRATDSGMNASKTDESMQQHQQALSAASQTVARHQRLQTPPPMHYYSSGSGGQKSKSADEASAAAAAAAVRTRDSTSKLAPADSSLAAGPPASSAAVGSDPQQRQSAVRIVETEQFNRESSVTAASQNRPKLNNEESQRLLDRLLLEKETMATELNHLRQQLQHRQGRSEEDFNQRHEQQRAGKFPQQQYPTLPEYDPDSPTALKRRIVDLEQQISDLQEASAALKSATSPVGAPSASETRMRAVLDELTVENEALKNELIRNRQQREQPDMGFIRAELDSLRSELDVLRDRNYQLERENRRLLQAGSPFLSDSYGFAGGFSADNPYRPVLEHPRMQQQQTVKDNSLAETHQHQPRHPVEQQVLQHVSDINRYDRLIDRFVADTAAYAAANPLIATSSTTPDQFERRATEADSRPLYYGSLGRADIGGDTRPRRQPPTRQRQPDRPDGQPLRHSLDRDFSYSTPSNQLRPRADLKRDEDFVEQQRSRSSWRRGRSASYTSVGGTSDSEDSNTATAELLAFADQNGGFRGGLAGAGGYPDKIAGKPRPNSASQQQQQQRQQRGGSGRHNRGREPTPPPPPPLFSTAGRLPFAPKQAADIRTGDLVKFTRCGGRISKGLVHFVGRLPGRSDYYVGVELDQEEGKHDGVYDGRRYFQCKPRKGVFVAFNKLIMCYQMPA